MNPRAIFLPAILAITMLTGSVTASAQTALPADHPTAELVKKYLRAVVEQDWAAAAKMLLPASLERRKQQMVVAIKNSPTMTEEAAKLQMLGIEDIRDLEKLSAQDAYIADRKAVHERMKITPEIIARKKETLQINILGLIPEEDGKIVHALVRTNQETIDTSIAELLLISMTQDKADAKSWLIVPDMQQPITAPLKEDATTTPAKEAAAPASAKP